MTNADDAPETSSEVRVQNKRILVVISTFVQTWTLSSKIRVKICFMKETLDADYH